jgi:hypothetical protein
MRMLTGAALVAMLLATPALAQQTTAPAEPAPVAQPSACAPLPTQPASPDGATADRATMEAGVNAYNAWATQYSEGVQCRRREAQQMRVTYDALIAQHNQAAQTLNTANTAMEAETAEFNQRFPARQSNLRRRDDEQRR